MDKINYKKIFNDNLDTIINLLSIPSIYDEGSVSELMPYGQHVHEAFVFMEDLAIKDGFKVINYDNQVLSVAYGDGDKRIDIVSHLDVVVADSEDFIIHIKDNKLYGRGSVDMKVPMFLTYLSLKLLKDKYPNINKEMRIVLGSDEERTMNDMKYYVSKAGNPEFAFSPDGYFPVGIGEKGAIMWTISKEYDGVVESFDGGSQCNIIPAMASCILKDDVVDLYKDIIDVLKINAEVIPMGKKTKIVVYGKAAHASKPSLGRSATIDLLNLIKTIYEDNLILNLYETYADSYGRGFNSFVSDDASECLSLNLGVLKIENNKVYGQVDCRYPFACNSLDLTDRLKDVSKLNVSLDYDDKPTLHSEDDPYVKVLLDTYRSITNDYSNSVISGGVTYSKVFDNCVSFGPNKIDAINLAHQKNEHIDLDYCLTLFEIYYKTIENLILMEV